MAPHGLVVILVLAVATVVAFGLVTAVGQRRRGSRPAVVVLAGVFFPVAWIGWYVHDELHRPTSSS
ncbi:MAG TPA: hypothetical protein VGE43_08430 [Acidimicrobiales bacterium]